MDGEAVVVEVDISGAKRCCNTGSETSERMKRACAFKEE